MARPRTLDSTASRGAAPPLGTSRRMPLVGTVRRRLPRRAQHDVLHWDRGTKARGLARWRWRSAMTVADSSSSFRGARYRLTPPRQVVAAWGWICRAWSSVTRPRGRGAEGHGGRGAEGPRGTGEKGSLMRPWQSTLAPMSVLLCAFLLGACSPGPGSSTTTTIPRVGLMHVGTDHVPPSLDTLVARLVDLGWVDGPQDELMAKLTDERAQREAQESSCCGAISRPGEVERQAARIRSRPRGRHRCVRGQIHRRCSGCDVGDPRIGSRWSSFTRPILFGPASWRACPTRAGT